jgi:hypothetical protein
MATSQETGLAEFFQAGGNLPNDTRFFNLRPTIVLAYANGFLLRRGLPPQQAPNTKAGASQKVAPESRPKVPRPAELLLNFPRESSGASVTLR